MKFTKDLYLYISFFNQNILLWQVIAKCRNWQCLETLEQLSQF